MRLLGWFGYRIARGVTAILSIVLWRTEVVGAENVPLQGPFLLCPVHRSNIDGPLTATFTRVRMKYLSKKEMFENKYFSKLFWAMGAIPVNRGAPDRVSLNHCLTALEEGWGLVLFPEGGRKDGPVVEEVLDGAAYLALRAGVPIVPVGIEGSELAQRRGSKRLRRQKIHVVIGTPFELTPGETTAASRSAIRAGSITIKEQLQAYFDAAMARGKVGA